MMGHFRRDKYGQLSLPNREWAPLPHCRRAACAGATSIGDLVPSNDVARLGLLGTATEGPVRPDPASRPLLETSFQLGFLSVGLHPMTSMLKAWLPFPAAKAWGGGWGQRQCRALQNGPKGKND